MKFEVRFAQSAEADMFRLADFLIDRAESLEDLDDASGVMRELRDIVIGMPGSAPFSFRKVGRSPLRRELVIPLRSTGYVAMYEIDGDRVIVLAVRHQREADYH